MAGNPVLLLHGFTTSAQRTWHEPGWVDLLSEAGRDVIAPDLLGHGNADKPHDPEAYANLEADIVAALPDGPVDAIGYSAGAGMLLVMAAANPDRFGKIVLGGIGESVLREREGNPILDAIEGRASADNMVAEHFRSMATSDGNDPQALAAFLRRNQRKLDANDLGKIMVPALIVIGDKDFAGPGEPLQEALGDAQLLTLRGVDHFGLPKAFPFLEQALDFLGAAPF